MVGQIEGTAHDIHAATQNRLEHMPQGVAVSETVMPVLQKSSNG
jgi:hypothetical protein